MKVFGGSTAKQQQPPGVLDIIEEALGLVRNAPLYILARYYLTTLPFVAAMFVFWAYMSRAPFAHRYLTTGAAALVLLFAVMKTGQALFARDLQRHLAETPPDRWRFRRVWRIAVNQTTVHATAVLVYPWALLLPFLLPWVYGTYQNLTVLEEGSPRPTRTAMAEAVHACARWPHQHVLFFWLVSPCLFVMMAAIPLALLPPLSSLTVEREMAQFSFSFLTGLMMLLFCPTACLVAANAGGLLMLVLSLTEGFTGRSIQIVPVAEILNSGMGMALLTALVFLAMDPVSKAVYVVRCHHGEAMHTGEDLRLALRRGARRVRAGALLLVALCAAAVSSNVAAAQDDEMASDVRAVAPVALERAIGDELSKPRYAWRLPGERFPGVEGSWFERHVLEPLERFRDKVGNAMRGLKEWVDGLLDWLFDRNQPRASGSLPSFRSVARVSLVTLAAALLAVLLVFLYRIWRARSRNTPTVAEAVPAVPDLSDENTLADALPEDEWVALANEMVALGDYRLAIRALYLALLSRLAEAGYITVARHKSNLDYARELAAKAIRDGASLRETLRESTWLFESVWYGRHEARREHVEALARHQERLRGHAG